MQGNMGLNSLEISQQFIHNTKGYETILKAFKEKKNHDYKKFSNHLTSILKADKASFDSTTVTLSKICTKMQAAIVTINYYLIQNYMRNYHYFIQNHHIGITYNINIFQGSSILGGFIKYWQQSCSIKFDDLREFILNKWSDFDTLLIYENLLDFIRKIAIKQAKFQQLQKCLKKICYNLLQDIDPETESQKILYIIKYGDLYDDFSKQFILQKIVTCRYQSIKFFYNILQGTVSKNEIQKLIDYLKKQYIDYTLQARRENEMDAAIKDWKIDVKSNSKIVENGYKKYLRYVLNNNSLFFIQDLLLNYPDVIAILVDILYENRKKYKEALHFINKYEVKIKLKGKIIDELCNSREKFNKQELQNFQMKNILFENDSFGPTQLSVLGQPDQKYLMLPQFGIKEKDVIFVDDSNFASIGFEQLKKSKVIGLDCQSVSAKYKNGEQFVSIAQLSTLKRVFIYDLVKLKNNQKFLNQIVELFKTYQGSFVGHSVKNDIKELFVEIKKHYQINFQKLNILDTLQIYEAKFRKKEKLCNICSQLCGFAMSKYQQCSGWGNRPLRKAQLHYAALDAFIPIKIVQTLLTTKFD